MVCGRHASHPAFGVPPYELPDISDGCYQLIITGQLRELLQELDVRDWVSEDAVDLVQGMLRQEAKRMTVNQMLAHSWLRGNYSISQSNQDNHNTTTTITVIPNINTSDNSCMNTNLRLDLSNKNRCKANNNNIHNPRDMRAANYNIINNSSVCTPAIAVVALKYDNPQVLIWLLRY